MVEEKKKQIFRFFSNQMGLKVFYYYTPSDGG